MSENEKYSKPTKKYDKKLPTYTKKFDKFFDMFDELVSIKEINNVIFFEETNGCAPIQVECVGDATWNILQYALAYMPDVESKENSNLHTQVSVAASRVYVRTEDGISFSWRFNYKKTRNGLFLSDFEAQIILFVNNDRTKEIDSELNSKGWTLK